MALTAGHEALVAELRRLVEDDGGTEVGPRRTTASRLRTRLFSARGNPSFPTREGRDARRAHREPAPAGGSETGAGAQGGTG
jgi:hypothetical protein